MLISIIVPIFNTPQKFFSLFLTSLFNIESKYFEFVLIDDGSESYIFDICQDFCQKDYRFKYYFQQNQGVSIARNYGIEQANGEWLLFADPDDIIRGSLEDILERIKFCKEDLFFLGYEKITNNDKTVEKFQVSELVDIVTYEKLGNSYLIDSLLKLSLDFASSQGFYLGTPWSKLIRKKFLIDNSIKFDKFLVKRQDALFMIDVFLANPNIGFLDQVIYCYRIDNTDSITKKYNSKIHEVYLYLLREVDQRNSEKFFDGNAISLYTYDLMKELLNLDYCNAENPSSYNKRRRDFLEFRNDPLVLKNLNSMRSKEIKLWKRILYRYVYKKNFFVLNNIYIYRKIIKNKMNK